ncbi:hypothetical protein BDW59DRAFT_151677 [Aspergillus cavernicola]|uniref:Zn(2)-C6 fungal-type domain-containing protein n=1 Tax=Aspergillus cavernicola TaxID=176166 RepID=A0ABR4HUD5_9EURO
MPSRRPHRKSRHGCMPCKQRRVKCDETRPACSNCTQRDEPCEYVAEASYIWAADEKPQRRTRRRQQSSEQSDMTSPYTTTQESFSILDSFGGRETGTPSNLPLEMTQLRLLVNWQNETCQFFSRDSETRVVWQIYLVDEALKTPPLMHGILAVSALHLSLAEPGSEHAFWLGLATSHKGEALQWLRESMENVNPDNATTMLGLASLVVAFAFGSALTGLSDADKPSLEALNDVFVLCRGIEQITKPASSFLRGSNFASLFSPASPATPIPNRARESLDQLDQLNLKCQHPSNEDTAIYAQAITALRELAALAFCQPNSMTLAGGWPMSCAPEYLEYVRSQRSFALVVLAHYGALLYEARGNWFVQYWGRSVVEDIIQILDSTWTPHISWPISEVLGEAAQLPS